MTIKDLYCMPKTIARHLQPPLGSYLDGFQEWMSAKKFSVSTMIQHIIYITLFSEYLKK